MLLIGIKSNKPQTNQPLGIKICVNSPIFSEINNKSINYNKSTNEIELKTFNSFLVWFGWLIVDFIGELSSPDYPFFAVVPANQLN